MSKIVADVMSTAPIVVEVPGSRADAINIMVRQGLTGLPVVRATDGKLMGVVSRRDLFRNFEEQQLSLIYRDVSGGALETVLLIAEPKFQHISSTMVREMIKYGQNLEKYMPLRAAELVKGWREDHGEQ